VSEVRALRSAVFEPSWSDTTQGGSSSQRTGENDASNGAGKLTCGTGTIGFHVPEFLDDAVTDLIPAEAAHRPQIVLALNNRQPRDAMIEHRS
jgi:hypothetical protein